MKRLIALVAAVAFNTTILPYANATIIEWGNFGNIAPPTGGSVSSSSGGLSFDVNYIGWSSGAGNTSGGAAASTNNILEWDDYSLLQGGGGRINYQLDFDNIVSHDDSLYFSAIWLWSGRPITITAFDASDVVIDLSTATLVDTFFGAGPTTWNSGTGQLTMFGGAASEHGGIVDLSGLNMDRINVRYTAGYTLDGFSLGLASNEFIQASAPTPGTLLLLAIGFGLLPLRYRLWNSA